MSSTRSENRFNVVEKQFWTLSVSYWEITGYSRLFRSVSLQSYPFRAAFDRRGKETAEFLKRKAAVEGLIQNGLAIETFLMKLIDLISR